MDGAGGWRKWQRSSSRKDIKRGMARSRSTACGCSGGMNECMHSKVVVDLRSAWLKLNADGVPLNPVSSHVSSSVAETHDSSPHW